MAEYSRSAKGHFTSTGGAQIVNLPFQPTTVELWNYTVANSAATSQNVASAYWDVSMGQGFAIQQGYDTNPRLIYDTVVANGISTFSAGLLLQFGAQQQVVATTKSTGNFQVTGHGYSTGDVVLFEGLYQSATTGMPQICGIPMVITVVDANNFTISWNVNQSNFTDLSASPAGAYVKKVLYPFLYSPGVSYILGVTRGSTTSVSTSAPHNLVVGQEVAFRIPANYAITQLNSLPNVTSPGKPLYGHVVSVSSSQTVVVNISSSAFTAYNSNVAVSSVPGLSFPQMIAVGDVNTGGVAISSGSPFYPSPLVNNASTINGPAISGSFVNNTSQGFVVGAGAGTVLTTSKLVGASTNVIYWRAEYQDYAVN